MKKFLSARRVPKDLYIQALILMIAGAYALIFPSGRSLAMFSNENSMSMVTLPTVAQPAVKKPLFTRQRHNFQVAIDTLADGAKSNPELRSYYQGLMDRIANGRLDPQPKTEPKDAAGKSVVKTDQTGKPSLVSGDLDFEMNPEIQSWVTYFTATGRGKLTMQTALGRAGKYLPIAKETFAKEGLPTDLVFLAQAESTWLPKIDSRVKARGLWQFMPDTGQDYGLNENQWIDERSDPVRSTVASAQYLRDLYYLFDDWPLAMAAYNSGENRVMRAIVANGNPDFWELHSKGLLPNETRNYVPIILSIITVAKNYQSYGFDVNFDPAMKYDTITVNGQTSLQLVADCAGSSLDQIQSMNPQFSLQTTSPNISQNVYVPTGSGLQAMAALQTVPVDKRVTWRVHHSRDGESLNDVATAYQVSVEDLRSSNKIDGDQLQAGAVLNIPVKAKTVYIPAPTRASRSVSIVRRYGKQPVVAKRGSKRSPKRRRR